jgi:hypothetical protein
MPASRSWLSCKVWAAFKLALQVDDSWWSCIAGISIAYRRWSGLGIQKLKSSEQGFYADSSFPQRSLLPPPFLPIISASAAISYREIWRQSRKNASFGCASSHAATLKLITCWTIHTALPFIATFTAGAIAGVSEILTFYPLGEYLWWFIFSSSEQFPR